MATSQKDSLLHYLHRAAMPHDAEITDGQLLERFLTAREPTAFEALLRRHGPMVLGVCRRVLVHEQDAEDAFQATFLVLIRGAASIMARDCLGTWLYSVACRTARQLKVATIQRRSKEMKSARPESLPERDDSSRELRAAIDKELNLLPRKYRELIVLCDLEGQTRKVAAQQLGCPEGTVDGRLARARNLLAKRLARYGLTALAGPVGLALASNAAAAPVALIGSTVAAAARVAAGETIAGAVSAPVASLTEGVLHAMWKTKVKRVLAIVLTLGMIGVGCGTYFAEAAPLPKEVKAPAPESLPTSKDKPNFGLPLNAGPTQVLASIDKDGKLVIKKVVTTIKNFAMPKGPGAIPGAPPGGGLGPVNIKIETAFHLEPQTYSLDDVEALDTNGKAIPKLDIPKLLKEETPALASLFGQKIDPLHLRLLKEGTLTFVLPRPPAIGFGGAAGGAGSDNINLPKSGPLTQVWASRDKDGKVVIKMLTTKATPLANGPAPAVPPGGGIGGGLGGGNMKIEKILKPHTYSLDEVEIFDADGKIVPKQDVSKLLKEETLALASIGQKVDLLHLRVLKEGTLTFALPAPKGVGAFGPVRVGSGIGGGGGAIPK